MKRWLATVIARTEGGREVAEHGIDELEELQDIVERGPSFEAIVEIRITYQLGGQSTLTEQARRH